MINSGFISGPLWRMPNTTETCGENDERGNDVHKLIPAWQALQSAAPLARIENEADYAAGHDLAE